MPSPRRIESWARTLPSFARAACASSHRESAGSAIPSRPCSQISASVIRSISHAAGLAANIRPSGAENMTPSSECANIASYAAESCPAALARAESTFIPPVTWRAACRGDQHTVSKQTITPTVLAGARANANSGSIVLRKRARLSADAAAQARGPPLGGRADCRGPGALRPQLITAGIRAAFTGLGEILAWHRIPELSHPPVPNGPRGRPLAAAARRSRRTAVQRKGRWAQTGSGPARPPTRRRTAPSRRVPAAHCCAPGLAPG